MSAFLTKRELLENITRGDEYAVLIDESATVNLGILQGLLNFTNEDSVKNWWRQYGVKRLPGNSWITTGRQINQAMERYFESEAYQDEAR